MKSSTIEILSIFDVNLTLEEIKDFMSAKTVDDKYMQEIVKKEVTKANAAALKGVPGDASLDRIRRLNIVDVSVPMASFLKEKSTEGSTLTIDTLDKWIQHNAELDLGFQKKDAETTRSLTLTEWPKVKALRAIAKVHFELICASPGSRSHTVSFAAMYQALSMIKVEQEHFRLGTSH